MKVRAATKGKRPGGLAARRGARSPASREGMEWIPGGVFRMGSDDFYPEEAPAHAASVGGFWIDRYPVTNAQFRAFVEATGHVTLAERPPDPARYPEAPRELLVPGSLVFLKPTRRVSLDDWSAWWAYVPGASWRSPEGPESSLEGRDAHPVVHIAFEDAEAYAAWAGKALPTEAQWERAARGGLDGAPFTWGDEVTPEGKIMANTWQGEFPSENLRADGRASPMAVGSFPPNGYGLYDMAGNVWEWTRDWYAESHAATGHARAEGGKGGGCCAREDPRGGSKEGSYDINEPGVRIPRKVLKGGSFLCAPNYCFRFRPAARHPETVDTSTCHIGFRCVLRG